MREEFSWLSINHVVISWEIPNSPLPAWSFVHTKIHSSTVSCRSYLRFSFQNCLMAFFRNTNHNFFPILPEIFPDFNRNYSRGFSRNLPRISSKNLPKTIPDYSWLSIFQAFLREIFQIISEIDLRNRVLRKNPLGAFPGIPSRILPCGNPGIFLIAAAIPAEIYSETISGTSLCIFSEIPPGYFPMVPREFLYEFIQKSSIS